MNVVVDGDSFYFSFWEKEKKERSGIKGTEEKIGGKAKQQQKKYLTRKKLGFLLFFFHEPWGEIFVD